MRTVFRSTESKWLRRLALLSLAPALAIRCGGGVPLTASAGAELSISANPTAIPAVDGVSTITVVGFKGPDDGGGPLPDGTQIFLTTNVGVIDERVEMKNGVARGFLRSDGRAGLATVEARSGAGITATLANPVLIGQAQGVNLLLTANPTTVRAPDFTTELVVTAFDNDNNRLRDVPVIFTSSAGALASHGSVLTTNANGQASDRLTLFNETSASVTAVSGAISSNAVTINRGTAVNPVVNSVAPSSGSPGDTLNVLITGANFQQGATVSFGQGITTNSVTFINSQTLRANITIDPNARVTTTGRTVTVTNPDGGTGSLADGFLVVSPTAGPTPTITSINPASSSLRDPTPVTLTITGTNFQSGATVSFDPGGIIIDSTTVNSSTQITVVIRIDITVGAGETFDVTVTNPDGGQVTKSLGFTAN